MAATFFARPRSWPCAIAFSSTRRGDPDCCACASVTAPITAATIRDVARLGISVPPFLHGAQRMQHYNALRRYHSGLMRRLVAAAVAVVLCSSVIARVAPFDWPQFLGPDRNGTYTGPPLSETWGTSGPRVVWRKQ